MSVPEISPANIPADFEMLVSRAQSFISELKVIDYASIYKELGELNVPTTDNPSLQKMLEEIGRIQAAKDRLATILVDAEHDFRTKQRCASLLSEGWLKFSSESAVDKRKSDAAVRMSQFVDAAGEAETMYKTASRIMKNLDDKQGSISRMVTVHQMMFHLRDINKGGNSDTGTRSVDETVQESDMKDWDEQPDQ